MTYEYIIWLEIHIKLHTRHKIFCFCENTQDFDSTAPNTHICPTCTAQPGSLPIINKECIDTAIRLWHIFGSELNKQFSRDRKSYFYPDSPTGYQITQFAQPIIKWGKVSFYTDNFQHEHTAPIHEAHLENDTAKTITIDGTTYIDFNRSGGPLIEIVTEPYFTNDDQVIEFLKELQRLVRWNDIGYADLEKGQMRVDVNLSVKPIGQKQLGVRNEVKNLNSFAAIRKAIAYEYQRHSEILAQWQTIEQETRWRDDTKGQTYTLRSKEQAHDYRYFTEANLPAVDPTTIDREAKSEIVRWFDRIRQLKEFGFHKEYIHGLMNNEFLYGWFQDAIKEWYDPKTLAKRLLWPIAAVYNEWGETSIKLTTQTFVEFVDTVTKNNINDNVAKQIMEEILQWHRLDYAMQRHIDINQVGGESIRRRDIHELIDENEKAFEDYKGWKTTTKAFFVWLLMKKTKWSINAGIANTLVWKVLDERVAWKHFMTSDTE